uniref:Uncharacterized protein n=1 Tax=Romanomermis culicivorax TaxID=13658 RepID=A0A915IRI3_ROMCU
MSSDASRFYYLRLMSRKMSNSGQPSATTKPKFVQWGEVQLFSSSLEENPDLEVGHNIHLILQFFVGEQDLLKELKNPHSNAWEIYISLFTIW